MSDSREMDLKLFSRFRQFSDLQLQRITGFQGQGLILTLLRKHGTLTQRELSSITQRRSATLSEQLDNMENAGLITRAKNAADKRNIDVTLTEPGMVAAKKADEIRNEAAHAFFSVLDAEEKEQLYGMLAKLIAARDCIPITGE